MGSLTLFLDEAEHYIVPEQVSLFQARYMGDRIRCLGATRKFYTVPFIKRVCLAVHRWGHLFCGSARLEGSQNLRSCNCRLR